MIQGKNSAKSFELSQANLDQAKRVLSGQIIVIKYGGNAMGTLEEQKPLLACIAKLSQLGAKPVLVHGGGPQINELLDKLNIASQFFQGMRQTNKHTMDAVQMVLAGLINPQLVATLTQQGAKAIGLTGMDNLFMQAKKLHLAPSPGTPPVDLGHVGEVATTNPSLLQQLLKANFIPVVAPVCMDKQLNRYNINADLVASKIAIALKAQKLILMTNTQGIVDKQQRLIQQLSHKKTHALIADRTIHTGMLPKIRCALETAEAGVSDVHIVDGRSPEALTLLLLQQTPQGTLIQNRH